MVGVISLLVISFKCSGLGETEHRGDAKSENEVAAMETGGEWVTMAALS